MFWSKLWLCLVTLAAGLAVALVMLVQRPLDRDLEREAGARLVQAEQAATQVLKINARRWMDTSAQVAADAVIVTALEQASAPRGPADLTIVHRTVQDELRHLNERLKVEMLMATDAKGRVIARAGVEEGEYKDFVDGLPLVADALRGLRGDDSWSIGGKLYRVAASPVIAKDKYVGALVIGQEVNTELALQLKQLLEVDVAFLLRGRVLASSTQEPVVQKLAVLPPLNDEKQLADLLRVGHTPPLSVDSEGGPYLVVLGPFVGEAAGHKAAFALMLPRPGAPPIGTMLQNLIQPAELKSLPWITLAPVGGALLIALVLGLVLMRLEADRPLKRMAREAQALARGEIPRLDDDKHPGKLGTVARAVNTTLDRLASTRSTGAQPLVRNPDAVLRTAGPQGPTSFGPTNAEPMRTPTPRTPLPPAAPPPPTPAGAVNMFAEPSDPGPMPSGLPISRPTVDLRGGEVKPTLDFRPAVRKSIADDFVASPESAGGSSPEPLTSPKMQLQPLTDTDAFPTSVKPTLDGPDLVDAPTPLPPLNSSQLPALPTQPDARGAQFDDEPTTTASSAGELAQMVQQEKKIAAEEHKRTPEEAAVEAELQQVYHDFIETKQRLGEPTDGVTFDKFAVKLRANRQQLITRYGCKTVKFQVYVKDGKAALKATPVST
jgi:hypothetical protein